MSVFFYGCITMDGYLADKNHNLDWLYETGTIEETGYESFYKNIDITINCDVVEFVKQIDRDKNIWIIGGNTILASLLDNHMVDIMIIQIAPVLLGRGIPIFSQKEGLKRFCLKEVKKYGQFAELIYSKI